MSDLHVIKDRAIPGIFSSMRRALGGRDFRVIPAANTHRGDGPVYALACRFVLQRILSLLDVA